MNDQAAAETPMSDHVARFWQHLETETVRILVDLRREVGHDSPDGPSVYWDGASFGDDVAKALVEDRARLQRRVVALERLISEEIDAWETSDAVNQMLIETAHDAVKRRAAFSSHQRAGEK